MSTFENGWICRECWSANRDVDDRCYRCHVDRPLGAPVTNSHSAKQPQAEHRAEAKAAVALPEEAPAIEPLASAAKASAAKRGGRYCLRCGAVWLPGAGFCTQCGTARHDAVSDADESAVATHTDQPRTSTRFPELRLPALNPAGMVHHARTRVNAYYAAHEHRWEVTMSALALAFCALAYGADRVSGGIRTAFASLLLPITIVFVAEYGGRLLAAGNRRSFVRDHLVELVALVPWLRAVRVARLLWVLWLRAGVQRLRATRMRPPLVPPNWRGSRLLVLWCVLLLLAGVATYGYVAAGETPGGEARFALVVMLLCVFSGLTAALATAFAARPADVPERLRLLEQLKSGSLISTEEYQSHRASVLRLLSGAEGTSDHASTTHAAAPKRRTAPASGTS